VRPTRPRPARSPRSPSAPALLRRLVLAPAALPGLVGRAASLERLLRGRGLIAPVGVLLVGVVFFNVSLLRLNEGITGTSERLAALKRENGKLRTRAARLGSSERIQRVAAARGLVLPAPGEVRYLNAGRSDARRAAARIRAPDPDGAAPTQVTSAPALPVAASPPTPAATSPAPAAPPPTASPPPPATAPRSAAPAAEAGPNPPAQGAQAPAAGAQTGAPAG
jgi:hypothetical protein